MATFRIGLGVTGGIAAYKAVELMRLLQRSGCEVGVAMTRHATEFVQPLTFRALGATVIVDDYDPANPDPIAHINFSQGIDLLLIAPATANSIAKFASGIADDFLSSMYLATDAPVMIAPAMNTQMWERPATRRNVEQLKLDGVHFVAPVAGELACKTVGTGKLEDVENIARQAMELLGRGQAPLGDLSGETVLITVGGTREAIDPVRFISNRSSGRMGFAVAEAARDRGASVTVVVGSVSVEPPTGVAVVRVQTAREMYDAVVGELPRATIFVGAAAVADYAPAEPAAAKIKKSGADSMTLELVKTPDILSDVSRDRPAGMLVIGFAAETSNVIEYAREKLEKKGLDLVVANDVTTPGAGFDTSTNVCTVLTRDGRRIDIPLMEKRLIADRIMDAAVELRRWENKV